MQGNSESHTGGHQHQADDKPPKAPVSSCVVIQVRDEDYYSVRIEAGKERKRRGKFLFQPDGTIIEATDE